MHPDPQALRRYLLGDLPPDEADSIERHMADCPNCEETFHSAGVEKTVDSLVEKLRTGSESLPFDGESELQAMLEKLRRFGIPPHDLPQDETVASVASGRDVQSRTAEPVPASLGEYDLEEVLGSGGMGTVYRAMHRRLRRRVAIKLLRADRTQDSAALDRFEREMEAVGRLEHPNLVRALDAGEANGTLYLAMEYVDGAPVSALVGAGKVLPTADACEIVRQAAVGLAAAHRSGLVHRDVKPGNLMLARSAAPSDDETAPVTVKALDLGLARIQGEASPGSAELTSAGQVMGTVDYMAPEQAESSRDVGPAADVYALGATLYRLLTGISPLGLDPAAGLIQKLAALVASEPLAIEARRPDLPRPLCDLVRRTLARDPAARPSAGELAKALQPFAVGADLATLLEAPAGEEILDAPLMEASASAGRARVASVSGFATSSALATATKGAANGGRNGKYVAIGLAAASLFAALVAGVMIFRVATDRGTLVVEIADPAIEAKLVAEGLKIVDTASGRDYVIQVAPSEKETSNPQASGEYDAVAPAGTTLRVVGADGLEFEANQFKLVRGETVRIKVYAVKSSGGAAMAGSSPSSPSGPLPAFDDGPGWLALAQKRYGAKDFDGAIEAATKALSVGVDDRNEALRIRAFAHATRRILPPAIDDLNAILQIDPQNAEALRLRSLVHRELDDAANADADAAAAAAIDAAIATKLVALPPASLSPNQRVLKAVLAVGGYAVVTVPAGTMYGFGPEKARVTVDPAQFGMVGLGPVTDPAADENWTLELLAQASAIDGLNLSLAQFSDKEMQRLVETPSLAKLTNLHVKLASTLDATAWSRLASLKNLRMLRIDGEVQPLPEALASLMNLETLHLDVSSWSDDDLAGLRDLPPTLRELTLVGADLGGELLLAIVADLPLHALHLETANVSDADVAALAETKMGETLVTLGIGSPNVTDAVVESLRKFPKLTAVAFNVTSLTPEGLVKLGELPGLFHLELGATVISREAIDAFRERNPNCQVWSNYFGRVPPLEQERAATAPMTAGLPAFDDGPGWLALAQKRYDAKDFDGAIEAAKKALVAGVEDRSAALKTRAFACATRRKLAESQADLDLLVNREANDAEALRLRSLVRRELGDDAGAEADAAAAEALDPEIATRMPELPPASLSPNQKILAWMIEREGGILDGRPIGGYGERRITYDPPRFESLALDAGVDDETVELLVKATAIDRLFFHGPTDIGDAGLARLCASPALAKLSEFEISAPRVTKEGWDAVGQLSHLRELHLKYHDFPPIAETLTRLRKLEILELWSIPGWDAEEIEKLQALPATLREFGTTSVRSGDAIVHALEGRPLEYLALVGTDLDDERLAKLAAPGTLETLNVCKSNLSDAGLAKLGTIPTLTRIELAETQVTRAGIDAFRAANPRCRVNSNFGDFPPLAEATDAAP